MLPNLVISGGRRDTFALHLQALHHSCAVLFYLPRGEVTSALPFSLVPRGGTSCLQKECPEHTVPHGWAGNKGDTSQRLLYDNSCSRNLETVFRHSLERYRFCLNCAYCLLYYSHEFNYTSKCISITRSIMKHNWYKGSV